MHSILSTWSVCELDLITLWMCPETERLLVIVAPSFLIVAERCMPDNCGGSVVECLLLFVCKTYFDCLALVKGKVIVFRRHLHMSWSNSVALV